MGTDRMGARECYREVILDNIEYSYLVQDSHIDREQLDEIVDLIVDTVCSARKVIRIAGDDYPAEVVKSRFMKLDRLMAAAPNMGFRVRPKGMNRQLRPYYSRHSP